MSLARRTSYGETAGERLRDELLEAISQAFSVEPAVERALETLLIGYIASHHSYSDEGVRRPETVLLRGAPGTGKSSLPIAFALAMGAPYTTYTVDPNAITTYAFYVEVVAHSQDGRLAPTAEHGLFARTTIEANSVNKLPVLIINEVDKVPPSVLQPLMQAIPEGYVRSPYGSTHPVNGLIVGTANTKDYDATSRELPTALADRFSFSEFFPPHTAQAYARIMEKIVRKAGGKPEIRQVDQKLLRTSIEEYRTHLKAVASDQRLVTCFSSVLATLSGTYPGREAYEVSRKVVVKPGARAAISMVFYAAGLRLIGYEMGEDDILRVLVSTLSHRIQVSPGEQREAVIEEAYQCSCQRTRTGVGAGGSGEQPQIGSSGTRGSQSPPSSRQPTSDAPQPSTTSSRRQSSVSSFTSAILSTALAYSGSSDPKSIGGHVDGKSTSSQKGGKGSAILADPSRAASIARSICNSCGLDPAGFIEKISRGQSFSIRGVVFDRVGSYWAIYPSTPEAAEILGEAAVSVSKEPGSLILETSYRDFDEVLKALKLAGGSLEQALENPLYWSATATYQVIRLHGSNAVGKVSAILRFFGALIADRMVRRAGGEVEKLVRSIQRYTRSGVIEGYVEERTPIGRIDLPKTAIKIAVKGVDAKPVQRLYIEPMVKIVLVIDKSGSMEGDIAGFKKIAYAAGIAALIANSANAVFDVMVFDTNTYLLGRDLEQGAAIDKLASISNAGGGTSYASAIDYVADIAEDGSAVVIVGDFIDGVLPSEATLSKLSGKDIRFILCPTPGYEPNYLEALRKTLNAEVIYPDKEL